MQGPIREPKRVSQMESSEIAFSLFDKDKDGYVTSNEMKKISKTLTEDQVNKESYLLHPTDDLYTWEMRP